MVTDTYNEASGEALGADGEAKSEANSGASNGQALDPLTEALNKVKELEAKAQEADKKYLYLYSEFENFRRRNERERIDFLKFGNEGFLKDLLQVVDNFERAVIHAKSLNPEKGSPLAVVNQGIEMIHFQLMESLKAQGVTTISAVGAKFDPAFHEAVSEEEGSAETGTILKEAQKGYMLHGRLLRAARVVISKKV